MSNEEITAGKFTHSATIGAIGGALAQAQGRIEAARKDRNNTFFSSRYATLSSVWDACRAALSEAKIGVVQSPLDGSDETRIALATMLVHESGEWMRAEFSAPVMPQTTKTDPVGKRTPQSVGSAITYLRRYALGSMVGVASDDDDGALASGNVGPANDTPAPSRAPLAATAPVADARLEATYIDALSAAANRIEVKALGVKISKVAFDEKAKARLGIAWQAALVRVTPAAKVEAHPPDAPLLATSPEHVNGAAE